jgi:hypothetical protein
MRLFGLFLLTVTAFAQSAEDREVIGTVQRLFDAMSARDGGSIRALFVPGASMIAIRANGKVSISTAEEFATRIAEAKEVLLERMMTPKVMLQGNIAVLWAPYDFHRGGKLLHCGIDSVSLAKTEAGWKIAGVSYTVQTEGCPTS